MRIREIEEGVQPKFFEIITYNKNIGRVLIELAKSAINEMVLLLPTD